MKACNVGLHPRSAARLAKDGYRCEPEADVIGTGGKCDKYFNVAYAPVLEDGKGNRAVDVDENSNTDLW